MTVWVVIYTNPYEKYDDPIDDVEVFMTKPDVSKDLSVLDVYEREIRE